MGLKNLSYIIKVIVASLMIIGLGSSAFAVVGLNVVLSSQNPDPVEPGNFVFLNVKVSNQGDTTLQEANMRFIENDIFTLAKGSESDKKLGSIPAFSLEGEGFVIAKYKVFVDQETPLGLNTVEFELDTSIGTFNYEFDILVQDDNPRLQVNDFHIDTTEPGGSADLTIEVENINSISLKNVFITLLLDEVEDEVISTQAGTNQKVISSIEPGEKKIVTYKVKVSPEASAKPYLIPVNFSFEDSLGNSFSKRVFGSSEVYSKPIITLRLDSQAIYSVGNGRFTFAVANPGTSSVKGTRIEILDNDNYEVIEGQSQYIGDLNPDDFQTIQSEVYVRNLDAKSIEAKLIYLDSYNKQIEDTISIPIKLYTDDELNKFGLATNSGGGSSSTIIVLLIIFGIVGFFFRKRIMKLFGKDKKN